MPGHCPVDIAHWEHYRYNQVWARDLNQVINRIKKQSSSRCKRDYPVKNSKTVTLHEVSSSIKLTASVTSGGAETRNLKPETLSQGSAKIRRGGPER